MADWMAMTKVEQKVEQKAMKRADLMVNTMVVK
jgi:hypothetical protein